MLRRAASRTSHPWVTTAAEPESVAELAAPEATLVASAGAPQPGSVTPPAVRLPRAERGERPAVWWLGVHGGAGETTLSRLAQGTCAAGHHWPISAAARPRVVLVARSSHTGITHLAAAAREWAAGGVPVALLGAVVIADAPGRLPRELEDDLQVVAGAVSRVWRLPWCERWRLAPASPATAPRAVHRLLNDLQTELNQGKS